MSDDNKQVPATTTAQPPIPATPAAIGRSSPDQLDILDGQARVQKLENLGRVLDMAGEVFATVGDTFRTNNTIAKIEAEQRKLKDDLKIAKEKTALVSLEVGNEQSKRADDATALALAIDEQIPMLMKLFSEYPPEFQQDMIRKVLEKVTAHGR